jgi:hypothetical protein
MIGGSVVGEVALAGGAVVPRLSHTPRVPRKSGSSS